MTPAITLTNMSNAKRFCITCPQCGKLTSKKYAETHNGQCKNCATGSNPANEYGNDGYQQYNEDAAYIRRMENPETYGGDY